MDDWVDDFCEEKLEPLTGWLIVRRGPSRDVAQEAADWALAILKNHVQRGMGPPEPAAWSWCCTTAFRICSRIWKEDRGRWGIAEGLQDPADLAEKVPTRAPSTEDQAIDKVTFEEAVTGALRTLAMDPEWWRLTVKASSEDPAAYQAAIVSVAIEYLAAVAEAYASDPECAIERYKENTHLTGLLVGALPNRLDDQTAAKTNSLNMRRSRAREDVRSLIKRAGTPGCGPADKKDER
ncbi:MAG: hypothetical protein ACRD6W_08350 [Nitrososphaerales archaeon]